MFASWVNRQLSTDLEGTPVFLLHCHFVFSTKCRKPVFEKRHTEALEAIFTKVFEDFEVDLVEFDGEEDLFCRLGWRRSLRSVETVHRKPGYTCRLCA